MPTCIWCLTRDAEPSIEHIFPDALGCPDHFVLTGGVVCKTCNNNMAHLDQAVINDFDMFAYMSNVPRKGGRPPIVKGRGNLVVTRGRSGPEISINMDPVACKAHDGSSLGAYGRSNRNVDATLKRNGDVGTVSFSVTVGKNPKFGRGITKIGLSCLAYFVGGEIAVQDRFDPVRAFVRTGVGKRPVLMMATEDPRYKNKAWPPYISEAGHYIARFRLAAAEFAVDLSPSLSSNHEFAKQLEQGGIQGWTWV